MSEMKPVAWLYKARISGTDTWNTQVLSRKPVADADWVKGIVPLYTADQLAEAVAAERERWSVTVANALNWLKHGRIANARDDLKAAQRRAVSEAIRSASK